MVTSHYITCVSSRLSLSSPSNFSPKLCLQSLSAMSSDISSLSDGKGRDQTLPIKSRNIVRAVTPDSVVEEVVHHPEITITCKKCKNPTSVQCLSAHRAYHNALSALEYTSKKIPQNTGSLLKRRNLLVQELKNKAAENAAALNQMQKIDEAFELLKSYLDGTHDERFIGKTKVDLDYRAVALCCSSPCIVAVGMCWSENSRWKSSMEDTRVFQDYFGNDSKKCFFAIYDGHNGRFAADLAANDLHHHLLQEMSKFDAQSNCTCTLNLAELNDLSGYPIERSRPVVRKDSVRHILHEESVNILQQIMHTCSDNVEMLKMEKVAAGRAVKNRDPYAESMSQAFRKAFALTDHALSFGVQEQSRVRWSGCSALTCVIKNAGTGQEETSESTDTMMRGTQTDMKSVDDTKDDVESLSELGSIYIANAGNAHAVLCRGGQVHQLTKDHSPANNVEKQRLLKAGVAIHAGGAKGKANGILDTTRGLGNHGDPVLKSAILCEPYTMSVKIDQYAEFLILATNGLWEVLTNEEAVEITQKAIDLELHNTSVAGQSLYYESENTVKKETDGEFDDAIISQIDIEGVNASESIISVADGQDLLQVGEDANAVDPEGVNQSWSDDDMMSQKTDFESMISALMENDDGNEADVDTVTEMQTIYAKSHLSEKPSWAEKVRSFAHKVSERLVQAAILAGSKDNITVMVILFPGCKLQQR